MKSDRGGRCGATRRQRGSETDAGAAAREAAVSLQAKPPPETAAQEHDGNRIAECAEDAARRRKWPLPERAVCLPRGVLSEPCQRLPKVLRLLRRLKGWSLDELAAVTHLDRGYLWTLEKKPSVNPSLDVVKRLAQAYCYQLKSFIELIERAAMN